jgi:hypothetical protein
MFDLIMGIDRRMKYLDGALPMNPLPPPGSLTREQRIEFLTYGVPMLAYQCSPQSKDGDEITCAVPSEPVPPNKAGTLADLERMLRVLEVLFISTQRSRAAQGKAFPWTDPSVYVFQGNKIYRRDAAGNRMLMVDGDRLQVKVKEGGGYPRYFVDSVEVDECGCVLRAVDRG